MIKNNKTNKGTTSPSILGEYPKLYYPGVNKVEGIDYINVDIKSKCELGRKLSMVYSRPFNTIIGKAISIRMFANAISVPGFPMELLSKFKPTTDELKSIPKQTIKVPNYWALLAYAFCEKVKADKDLKLALFENELPFTVATKSADQTEVDFFNTKVLIDKPKYDLNFKLVRYVAIIRAVSKMIKEDKFSEEDIKEFIVQCKDVPEVELLEGVAVAINKAPANSTAKQGKVLEETPKFEPDEQVSAETSIEEEQPVEEAPEKETVETEEVATEANTEAEETTEEK